MSASDASTSMPAANAVVLPPGVQIGPGRETSQVGAQGQVVQGMTFPVTLPNQSATTVFVPYSLMTGNPQAVQQLFTDRINAIMSITG